MGYGVATQKGQEVTVSVWQISDQDHTHRTELGGDHTRIPHTGPGTGVAGRMCERPCLGIGLFAYTTQSELLRYLYFVCKSTSQFSNKAT